MSVVSTPRQDEEVRSLEWAAVSSQRSFGQWCSLCGGSEGASVALPVLLLPLSSLC